MKIHHQQEKRGYHFRPDFCPEHIIPLNEQHIAQRQKRAPAALKILVIHNSHGTFLEGYPPT